MSGFVSGIKDNIMGTVDKILGFPDQFEHPAARKAARIGLDIIVVLLGAMAFYMMTHMGGNVFDVTNFSVLADPSMTSMWALPIGTVICGTGIAWLIEDIAGLKNRRVAAKIASIIMPVLFLGGIAAMVSAGFHTGFTASSANLYFLAGLIIAPATFFMLSNAIKLLCQKEPPYIVQQMRREIRKGAVSAAKKETSTKKRRRPIPDPSLEGREMKDLKGKGKAVASNPLDQLD